MRALRLHAAAGRPNQGPAALAPPCPAGACWRRRGTRRWSLVGLCVSATGRPAPPSWGAAVPAPSSAWRAAAHQARARRTGPTQPWLHSSYSLPVLLVVVVVAAVALVVVVVVLAAVVLVVVFLSCVLAYKGVNQRLATPTHVRSLTGLLYLLSRVLAEAQEAHARAESEVRYKLATTNPLQRKRVPDSVLHL